MLAQNFEGSLKPIIETMKIFGFYHATSRQVKTDSIPKVVFNRRNYNIVVILVSWMYAIRYIPNFWINASAHQLIGNVIQLIWFCQCSLTLTVLFWHFQSKRGFVQFLEKWKAMFDDKARRLGFVLCEKKIFNFAVVMVVIGWVMFFANLCFVGFLLFWENGKENTFASQIANPFPPLLWIKILLYLCHALNTAAWIFPGVYFCVISYAISAQFSILAAILKKTLRNYANSFPPDLEIIRRKHLQLCHVISHLDRDFRWLLFIVLFAEIPQACINLYQTLKADDILPRLVSLFWLFACYVVTGISIFGAAYVNNAAHNTLEDVYDVCLDGATVQETAQLNMFVSKLSGTSIGFSLLGLVTFGKELLLTMGGIYLTYFFLLLQFSSTF